MDMPPTGPSKEEGLRLLKAGQLDEAIGVLESVAQSQSDDPQLHTYLGVAYNQKGDRLRAINHFEESLRIEESPRSYYNLGQVYESGNRVDEAVRQYRMAVELEPGYTMAQQALDRLRAKFEAEHPQPEPEQTQVGVGAWPGAEQTQTMPAGSQIPGMSPAGTSPYGPPPAARHGPPDLAARQREKEEKVAEQQRLMMKSGLIYGIVCGAIILPSVYFGAGRFFAFPMPEFAVKGSGLFIWLGLLVVIGAAVGSVIGLWVGYTCGGESAGIQAGAVLGVLFGLILGLIGRSSGAQMIFMVITFGGFGCFNGYMIGMLVDRSIGWD